MKTSDLTPLQRLNTLLDIIDDHSDPLVSAVSCKIRETLDELRVGFDDATELRAALGIPETATHEEAIELADKVVAGSRRKLDDEIEIAHRIDRLAAQATRHADELRLVLGIDEEVMNKEAVERARRIAYEAETARLIAERGISVRCASASTFGRPSIYWEADPPIIGAVPPGCRLHLAVRAAAGKGES